MSDEARVKRPGGSTGIVVNWCMSEGCEDRAPFGFKGRYGVEWYCSLHKAEGEKVLIK